MKPIHSNIFLVGPMGAGKTTVGRQLAKRTGLRFIDSDHEIEDRAGVGIPLIFEIEGEAGFRGRESAMIDELTQLDGIILATGGGAVLNPDNRHRLHERGVVIYLRAPLDHLVARTARSNNRPLLNVDNPRQRLQAILQERDPLYCEVADLIVATEQQPVRKLVQSILHKLNALDTAKHNADAKP